MQASTISPMAPDGLLRVTTPEGLQLNLVLAGVGTRLGAALLDWLIKAVVIFLALIFFAFGALQGDGESDEGGGVAVIFFLVSFTMLFLYDILWEVFNRGRTPGKMAAGLRVVRADGQVLTPWASIVRNFLRIIDDLALIGLVAIVSMAITRKNQRLGDLAAGTVVVLERVAELPEARLGFWLPPWTADPSAPFWSWDTTAIPEDHIELMRSYLTRRDRMEIQARDRLAGQLAGIIRAKVPGSPTWRDGDLITAVVAARTRTLR